MPVLFKIDLDRCDIVSQGLKLHSLDVFGSVGAVLRRVEGIIDFAEFHIF